MEGSKINFWESIPDIADKYKAATDNHTFVVSIDDNGSPERLGSMTNETYKIFLDGKAAVIRLPGAGTSDMIDRVAEGLIYKDLADGNFCFMPTVLYHDDSGMCITEFLEGYRNFDPTREGDRAHIAKALLRLHALSPIHAKKSDLLLDIGKYRKMSLNREMFPISDETRALMHSYIQKNQYRDMVLCHRDMMYNNILIHDAQNSIMLIDWEYSGKINRHWDLGCLLSESVLHFNIEPDSIKNTLLQYYYQAGGMAFVPEDLMMWAAIVDYVWAEWALAKSAIGEDCVEYGRTRIKKCEAYIELLKTNKRIF